MDPHALGQKELQNNRRRPPTHRQKTQEPARPQTAPVLPAAVHRRGAAGGRLPSLRHLAQVGDAQPSTHPVPTRRIIHVRDPSAALDPHRPAGRETAGDGDGAHLPAGAGEEAQGPVRHAAAHLRRHGRLARGLALFRHGRLGRRLHGAGSHAGGRPEGEEDGRRAGAHYARGGCHVYEPRGARGVREGSVARRGRVHGDFSPRPGRLAAGGCSGEPAVRRGGQAAAHDDVDGGKRSAGARREAVRGQGQGGRGGGDACRGAGHDARVALGAAGTRWQRGH